MEILKLRITELETKNRRLTYEQTTLKKKYDKLAAKYHTMIELYNDELLKEKKTFKKIESKLECLKEKKEKFKNQMKKTIKENMNLNNIATAYFFAVNLPRLTIEDYKVKRILGHGSNGIVFLAEVVIKSNMYHVALKMIFNFGNCSTTTTRGKFENEFLILSSKKSHPNIIQILRDFFVQPTRELINLTDPGIHEYLQTINLQTQVKTIKKTQFFVIEYHPFTLDEKLIEWGLSITLEEILKLSSEIFECFLFLFENRIVHRDVKLDNIFVSKDGRFVLGDFGESIETNENHCCKKKDLRAGNSLFTAPDVINAISCASDEDFIDFTKQYSWEVGCLIYIISYGDFPFPNYPLDYGILSRNPSGSASHRNERAFEKIVAQ